MDKNTITGLVLIAILLVGFSFLSRPSKEQLEAQQRYYDSIALVQQREEALKAKADAALANEKDVETVDSTSLFFNARQGTDSLITIQNDVAELTLSTKGGSIFSAVLKEYMEGQLLYVGKGFEWGAPADLLTMNVGATWQIGRASCRERV